MGGARGGRPVALRTARGAVRGILHAFEGARGGVVLAGGDADEADGHVDAAGSGIGGLCEELAHYLRAVGVTTLRLRHRHPHRLEECAYDVLAGVAALTCLGVERVVLIGWSANGPVVSIAGAAGATVAGLAETIAGTATVVGVAGRARRGRGALRPVPDAGRPPATTPRHAQAGPGPRPPAPLRDVTVRTGGGGANELVLYPGSAHDLERYATVILEKLCGWSKNLLPGPATDRPGGAAQGLAGEPAGMSHPAPQRPTAARRRLDQQWESIVAALEARDPARGATIRALLPPADWEEPGRGLRDARRVWRHLDTPARQAVLRACVGAGRPLSDNRRAS